MNLIQNRESKKRRLFAILFHDIVKIISDYGDGR